MERPPDLRPWLAVLAAIPGIRRARPRRPGASERATAAGGAAPDAWLTVETAAAAQAYQVEVNRGHPLRLATVRLAPPGADRGRALLLAQEIPPPLGERLRARGIDYVDLAGNCHLAGDRLLVHIAGRRLRRDARLPRDHQRESGAQVLFALAALPELAGAPVREIARRAGAGKSATAAAIERLVAGGVIAATARGRRVLRRDALIDRFAAAYVDHLRPRWLLGRYRPRERDLPRLEAAIAAALGADGWGLGGGAGGHRLDPHFRGDQTVVHVAAPPAQLAQQLAALPDRAGPLALIRTPMPIAFAGPVAGVVHPLLVYAELIAAGDERSEGAARRLRLRYLTDGA